MATKRITVSEALELEPGRVLFDVRTPAEYEKGHIPGALNLPLFSNEERAVVGTTYKQVDPYKAFLQGLEFVATGGLDGLQVAGGGLLHRHVGIS